MRDNFPFFHLLSFVNRSFFFPFATILLITRTYRNFKGIEVLFEDIFFKSEIGILGKKGVYLLIFFEEIDNVTRNRKFNQSFELIETMKRYS